MRAAAVDHRLEAIAGPPVVRVSEPTRQLMTFGGTAVSVGMLTDAASSRWMLLHLEHLETSDDRYAYVNPDGSWLENMGNAGRYRGLHWAYGPFASADLGLGRLRTSVTSATWLGPLAAVAYDRVLTDAQALRVVRHLAASLQRGESSLSLSLSLSLTHTHS